MRNPPPSSLRPHSAPPAAGSIDLIGAIALGIGGMMGTGLHTLLGLAARSAGVLVPPSFLLWGLAASLSVYSYARLGTAFPSRGGGAHFLLACLGDTRLCAWLNVFQYAAYWIATALYAAGSSEYVGVLAAGGLPTVVLRLIGASTVLLFGAAHADPGRLSHTSWPGPAGVVTGAALLYVTFLAVLAGSFALTVTLRRGR